MRRKPTKRPNSPVISSRAKPVLAVGVKVIVRDKNTDEEVDRAVVTRMDSQDELEITSGRGKRRSRTEFVRFAHPNPKRSGWRMLFEDPMGGGRCYSQRAPAYELEPVH